MTRLFVLGNGFDRAHCLNTDYSDFKKFVCEKEAGGGVYTVINNAEQNYINCGNSSKEWKNFEELLGGIKLACYSSEKIRTLVESLEAGIDPEKFIKREELDQIPRMNSSY
ncbi:hypothetical protein C7H83_03680 [Tetragenococcus halophilus]|uniref:Uncharacterized protein n=1 Tax=Tetragenococcus halophilus TaxID=51669 RepID=A0A3G5FH03_TETHA|nr:AbiH family protein [Tetragenococcus halophilus]AYW49647.1 hypothetical protein C7H83_03680 [Tetragenococcus halophilus]GBD64740.1 hypothetical protein TEHD23766T_2167 [Tetragenococcus halophilus subsp. flandriensis]